MATNRSWMMCIAVLLSACAGSKSGNIGDDALVADHAEDAGAPSAPSSADDDCRDCLPSNTDEENTGSMDDEPKPTNEPDAEGGSGGSGQGSEPGPTTVEPEPTAEGGTGGSDKLPCCESDAEGGMGGSGVGGSDVVDPPVSTCGDNIVDDDEECDDGNDDDNDGCHNDCHNNEAYVSFCGNGYVDDDAGEDCDDGNEAAGDGCDHNCLIETVEPQTEPDPDPESEPEPTAEGGTGGSDPVGGSAGEAGNGGSSGEAGSAGNGGTGGAIDPPDPVCGNGLPEMGESCDDGNTDDNDACVSCQAAYCGDGVTWDGEEDCDDGNNVADDGCENDCTLTPPNPVCGDGNIDANEQCDDGNTDNGDGCDETCQEEPLCTPTSKPPATGAMESVEFAPPEFHQVGEQQAATYNCFCRSANECYCTMHQNANGRMFRWDGVGYTEEVIPPNLNAYYITGDESELWLSGQVGQTLRAIVFRKVGNGVWEEETDGLPTGLTSMNAIGKVGNTVLTAVTESWTDPGPCQGVCQSVAETTIYSWSGSSWDVSYPAFNGEVAAFGGSSESDLYAGGSIGPAGDNTDAMLLRWNECEWENHSASLPSAMKTVSSISVASGEIVLTGDLGGLDSIRAVSTDLIFWDPADLPARHKVTSVAAVGRGASLAVGTYRPDGGEPVAFIVGRSAGAWGAIQYIPGYQASHVSLTGDVATIPTRTGVATVAVQ